LVGNSWGRDASGVGGGRLEITRGCSVTVTITADVVAWYAAVVATGAFGVNAYSAWRHRARLVVSARSGYR